MKIPYEVAPNGGMIRVPGEQVGKVRMLMAAEGLPKGGSIGYEIFDQKEGFGTTSFVQNINHLRAMEGELARTISTMGAIQSARVHLVLPQRELFSHNSQTATASVFIKTRSGASLPREQIGAIQHLIAAAVPQLQANQISIVDDKGNLLARPTDGAAGTSGAGGTQDEMRVGYEQAQARKIEELLAQTLGFGKVRAQVSADLDFDRITTSSEIFDPESQVVRSQQSTTEDNSASDGGSGAITMTNNLPGGQAAAGGEGGNKSNRAEETINYEINKTVRSQVRETGQVRRLSVAVVVDGTTTTDAEGKQTYQPRTEEELDQIKALVRSSVNYDATRGDTIEVRNMRFAQGDAGATDAATSDMIMGMPKLDLLRIAQTLLLAFIGLMVVLLVIRPILRKLFESTGGPAGGDRYLSTDGMGNAQLPPPSPGAFSNSLQGEMEDSEIEKMIDISRVEGRVKASSLRKVGEIVDKHPEEAVSILRNWIYQESR
ncbi:MAG TPA: flagellar M-ring protein FliF, partial [Rhodospirillaceae bacterium]|nr:flagellar M-ring protein FliF [Rhodospirillaceae bacterium]